MPGVTSAGDERSTPPRRRRDEADIRREKPRRTILYFAVVYLLGVALVALAAVPSIMASAGGVPLYLLGAFVFVALGTGAIKPNVMNFGADQYDTEDAEELVQQKAFFSYFYLTINIGVVFAMGFTVNLATSGSSEASAGTGYLKAYCIAAGAMLIALLCFALGTPRRECLQRTARVSVCNGLACKATHQAFTGCFGLQ
ncbi:Solute carrier family 15 member 2 (Peptide transporter 2) (PEPT2) [Durusdinium trenchii]|uniref:Solute carrier family 15 member 2 (Peptide transporter 2) (PEPT2) n=1 Tax=Durusdinium trenchii TaxID=1381693 RepID=A0ABP0NWN9_9DINO